MFFFTSHIQMYIDYSFVCCFICIFVIGMYLCFNSTLLYPCNSTFDGILTSNYSLWHAVISTNYIFLFKWAPLMTAYKWVTTYQKCKVHQNVLYILWRLNCSFVCYFWIWHLGNATAYPFSMLCFRCIVLMGVQSRRNILRNAFDIL